MRIDSLPSGASPLALKRSPPSSLLDTLATIIGYPAFDPAEDLAQQLQIFRGVFDKKRLQPGRLKGIKPAASFGNTVRALAQDCLTLGGNSGSALIDVSTAKVFGVAFRRNSFWWRISQCRCGNSQTIRVFRRAESNSWTNTDSRIDR